MQAYRWETQIVFKSQEGPLNRGRILGVLNTPQNGHASPSSPQRQKLKREPRGPQNNTSLFQTSILTPSPRGDHNTHLLADSCGWMRWKPTWISFLICKRREILLRSPGYFEDRILGRTQNTVYMQYRYILIFPKLGAEPRHVLGMNGDPNVSEMPRIGWTEKKISPFSTLPSFWNTP